MPILSKCCLKTFHNSKKKKRIQMKISNILEGIRMGASDLKKAAKKEYTIGFEFEVIVDSEVTSAEDIDIDQASELEDFVDNWDGFDFQEWAADDNSVDWAEVVLDDDDDEIESKFGRPDEDEEDKLVAILEAQENKRYAAVKEQFTDEQLDAMRSTWEYLRYKDNHDIIKNDQDRLWKITQLYASIKSLDALDRANLDRFFGPRAAPAPQLKQLEFYRNLFKQSVPKPINPDNIHVEYYVYSNKEQTEVIQIEDDIKKPTDIFKYFDTSWSVLRDLTEDKWYSDSQMEMEEDFRIHMENLITNTNVTAIEYVEETGHFNTNAGWQVVTDESLTNGAEIISPVMNLKDGIATMRKVFEIIDDDENLSTNNTTGLHINIGTWDGDSYKKLDLFKLLIAYNGKYASEVFGRSSNNYTKDGLAEFIKSIQMEDVAAYVNNLDMMNRIVIAKAEKKYDVNLSKLARLGYIEFRSAGGKDYQDMGDEAEAQIRRAVRALDLAANPMAARKPYLATLSKLVDKKNTEENPPKRPLYILPDYFRELGISGKPTLSAMENIVETPLITGKEIDNSYSVPVHREIMRLLTMMSAEHGKLEYHIEPIITALGLVSDDRVRDLTNTRLFRTVLNFYRKTKPNENK
jgi:hypothetical protein